MSTTIDMYPTTSYLPLVSQTVKRTQELFHALLQRHHIDASITIRAFYPVRTPGEVEYVADDVRWRADLELGFAYFLDGEWQGTSWPWCQGKNEDTIISPADLRTLLDPWGVSIEFLGQWISAPDLCDLLPTETYQRIIDVPHHWYEYRNATSSALGSTGYGLVIAALAEATNGIIYTDDAFDIHHNGETSAQFITWWGDEQIAYYGRSQFGG